MNYITSISDNQLKNESLVPELPFLTEVPKTLRTYPNWICWTYHQQPDGKLVRMPASPVGPLDEILKRCNDESCGLGFLLTPDDPITVVCMEGYRGDDGNVCSDAKDILVTTNTYTEIDDAIGELYVIGYAEGLWNVGTGSVRIRSDRFIVPITGHTMGAFPDIEERSKEFAKVSLRYCAQRWMERFESYEIAEGQSESSVLLGLLKECLVNDDWMENADTLDVWPFLNRCYKFTEPRMHFRRYMQTNRYDRNFRNDIEIRIQEAGETNATSVEEKSQETTQQKPEKEIIDPDDDWLNALHYDKRATKVLEDFYNITMALENHKEWQGRFSFDSFQHKALLDGEHPLSDPEEAKIIRWFGATDPFEFSGNREKLYQRAIYATAFQKTFDSLYDFITSLEWDGESRLLTWMTEMCGAPATPHSAWIGKMTIMQMVARALKPGIMARQVPIWEGPENKGKTRMITILGKPWSMTFDMSMDSKESHMAIQGVWVAEIAELNALKATRTETRIKSFISQTEDSFIPKYSNNRVSLPRRCCFIGTTNDDDYLPSLTGNTRWYPIRTEWFKHQRMEQQRNQLFAEALSILKSNPDTAWWEEPAGLTKKIRETRDERRPFNAYETDLKGWLDDRTPDIGLDRNTTSWNEIAGHFLQIDKEKWKDKSLQAQITSALKALGWTRKKLGESAKGLTVWVRPENED